MDDLKIRLVLEGAEGVQSGANKAADGINKLGQAAGKAEISAGQLRAAYTQLPLQLQDFFIQVQGGQSVLTAFAQQGSQVAGSFGGIGNAVRGVASLITPTVAILGTAAVTVGALAKAYFDGAAEAQAYGRALILSGNAAGVTAGQLQALAQAQAQVVGTQGQAAQALAALAATGKVTGSSLSSAAEAATRLARVGVPLEETAKKFASLGKEPLKALIDLNEAENFLTVTVYKQIKALTERGRLQEAATLAQAEYARVGIDRAKALEGQLGTLEKAWKAVGDVAKKTWDNMLNVGRAETTENRLKKVADELATLDETFARRRQPALGRSITTADQDAAALAKRRGELQQLAAELAKKLDIERTNAEAVAASTVATKSAIKADEDAAKAAKSVAAERDRDAAALERAVGLSGSYQATLTEFDKLRRRGVLTEEQYVKAVQELIQAQPVVREQMQAQAEAAQQVAEAEERGRDIYLKKIDAFNQSADAVSKQVLRLRDEEAALALVTAQNISLAEAIEQVTINRLKDQQAASAGDGPAIDAIEREIDARRELARLIGNKETRDVAKKSAEEAAREWKRASDEIERTITDALMRGFEAGKGFAQTLRDTLVNTFKTLVLRPTIQAIVQPFTGGLASLLGTPGAAGAATGGAAGGPLGTLGALGSLFGAGGLSGALQAGAGWLSGATTLGGSLSAAGSLIGTGTVAGTTSGLAMGAGALGPLAALVAASYFGGKAISNGYSVGGGGGGSLPLAGLLGGGAILGPVGGAVGGLLGGVINRAFGMKAKEARGSGIEGMASADGFAGRAFAEWFQKGGLFRSNKSGTDYSAVSSDQDKVLDQGITALYSATEAYAKVLGYPVDALKGYAASFKVAWGKTDEENQAAIQAAFVKLGDDLAARYVTQLAPLQKVGETISATLQRLSALQVFSNSLSLLGGVFARVASSSFDAREQLIGLAGGMDALSQQALGFAQNYYSREEIAGLKAKELQAAFSSAGIAADPSSREQFRALVESQDPNTDAGRKQLAALLALQGSFASVADYLGETGQTLSQAAAQAPADALMSPLLSSVGQQLQLAQQSMDAQYETRDATLQVVDAVKELTNAITSGSSGGGFVPSYRQPEITTAY